MNQQVIVDGISFEYNENRVNPAPVLLVEYRWVPITSIMLEGTGQWYDVQEDGSVMKRQQQVEL